MTAWTRVTSAAVCAVMLAVTAAPGLAADAAPSPKADTAANAKRESTVEQYRIGPEDTLQISVWKNEAMSRTVPVRPDGMVSLPLVNDVEAAGLTPMELRDLLTKKLAEYIPNPEVSVILTDVKAFKVSVIGEVAKPARYELKAWTTVLDVLALAGGFTQFAARTRIVILRPNGKTVTRIPFNYNKVIAASSEQENFYLQPGDIVLVP
jgi:polysaccharide export outer membrane protein